MRGLICIVLWWVTPLCAKDFRFAVGEWDGNLTTYASATRSGAFVTNASFFAVYPYYYDTAWSVGKQRDWADTTVGAKIKSTLGTGGHSASLGIYSWRSLPGGFVVGGSLDQTWSIGYRSGTFLESVFQINRPIKLRGKLTLTPSCQYQSDRYYGGWICGAQVTATKGWTTFGVLSWRGLGRFK